MKSETKIFQKRRKELMDSIGSNGIAILPAAIESVRNKDVNFRFRQDSDFYYLSGFEEPEAVIVIAPQRKHGEYIIFCREKNPEKETWDGYRAGQEGACEIFGGDDAFPIDDIDDILPGLIEGREKLYYSMGTNRGFDKQVMQWINNIRENIRGGAKAPHELISLDGILHEMRLIKDSEEISIIKKAAEISAQAHNRAMSLCKPGMYEYELEAEFLYQFRKNGGTEAYPSIVGSGANGCTLHYIENSSIMKNGDLVLIDAGMEYKGYAADISRTFPVNGKFTAEQAVIYDIVLLAQKNAIDKVYAGNHWNEANDAAVKTIVEGLLELKILSGNSEEIIAAKGYTDFYMHRVGHWMGMDVHDVGDYKIDGEWRLLEPGMITTIEPGIYIKPSEKVDERWWNIAIRIEDDILVTAKGQENLTISAIKERDEIEKKMKG